VLKEAVVNLCKEAKEMGLKSICKKLNLKGWENSDILDLL
jgi:hypothetical protein